MYTVQEHKGHFVHLLISTKIKKVSIFLSTFLKLAN